MVMGIGVDIIDISRFSKWVKDPKLILRFFNEEELDFLQNESKIFIEEKLAGHFAAKEAFVKTTGLGFYNITLRDICVKNDKYGKPFYEFYDSALKIYNKLQAKNCHLSISHDGGKAIAFAVLEG